MPYLTTNRFLILCTVDYLTDHYVVAFGTRSLAFGTRSRAFDSVLVHLRRPGSDRVRKASLKGVSGSAQKKEDRLLRRRGIPFYWWWFFLLLKIFEVASSGIVPLRVFSATYILFRIQHELEQRGCQHIPVVLGTPYWSSGRVYKAERIPL
jgi:hypothetical protein